MALQQLGRIYESVGRILLERLLSNAEALVAVGRRSNDTINIPYKAIRRTIAPVRNDIMRGRFFQYQLEGWLVKTNMYYRLFLAERRSLFAELLTFACKQLLKKRKQKLLNRCMCYKFSSSQAYANTRLCPIDTIGFRKSIC